MRGSGGQRPLAVVDLDDFVPGMYKQIAEDPSIVLLVLDHQNSFGHAFPTCCSTLIGTLRKNVEPAGGPGAPRLLDDRSPTALAPQLSFVPEPNGQFVLKNCFP